ncbi:MAG: hypothetical protein ETSY2_41195 [Candidatus Entotheonella gemina]|uniref:Uncharacterized protein n=1 Tax=Candidatus Entotheonella gemina TaxID=1429439 RepID=W4LNM3_9BACT|nr:MAG: hypothetical protein ETSY2_41195 [Candidatus Entotheonella gemina]
MFDGRIIRQARKGAQSNAVRAGRYYVIRQKSRWLTHSVEGLGLAIIVLRGTLWEIFMHLQRVQVPDFRALKNIDITFEKEFQPRIFPLGSQNGGGKSTLLQLIFVLLHCCVDSDRKHYLINMLENFHIDEGDNKRVLARIDIWDGDKTINLEFFSCKDDYIKSLGQNDDEIIDDSDFRLSIFDDLDILKNRIANSQDESGVLEDILSRLTSISKSKSKRLTKSRSILDKIDKFNSEIEGLQQNLDVDFYEVEKLNIRLQNVREVMNSNNYIYLCNHSTDKNSGEVLLCHIENIDIEESENFLKELSQKVFLAAPSTQVFLFLSKQDRNLLFQESNDEVN